MLGLQAVTGSRPFPAAPEGPAILLSCVLQSEFTVAQGNSLKIIIASPQNYPELPISVSGMIF